MKVNVSKATRICLLTGIFFAGQVGSFEESKAQDKCQSVLTEVSADIQGRIGAVISSTKIISTQEWRGDGEFMQTYQSPFNNADEIVIFYLASDMGRGATTRKQAQAAENIMNSSRLTREYAQQIISACEPVASVKFFYWEWFQGWSLHRNNELIEDKCKNPDGSNYYWGENVCL